MNKQYELAEEIIKKNPRVIIIRGNQNPTYSNGFNFFLVDFGHELLQFSGGRHTNCETKIVSCSKLDWLKDTIRHLNISQEVGLLKKNDRYYFLPNWEEEISDEECEEDGRFLVDCGGYLEIVK